MVMTRIIGHRGASTSAQANTLEAVQLAIDQGADGVEIDVRRTADDVLVLHHDAHLSDGRRIHAMAASDLPTWVPSLAEVLEVCEGVWTNIEVKNLPDDPDYDQAQGISLAVAGLIAAYEAHQRVLVSSFNMDSVTRIGSIDPEIELGWLTAGGANPAALIGRAEGRSMNAIHPHDMLVDESFVLRAHDAGLAVNVWTVNDMSRVAELAKWGVDGIITDNPAEALEILGRGQSSHSVNKI